MDTDDPFLIISEFYQIQICSNRKLSGNSNENEDRTNLELLCVLTTQPFKHTYNSSIHPKIGTYLI